MAVGHYICGTLQYHRMMDEFLRNQFQQHPEVYSHITLYMFEPKLPWVDVSALNQEVEAQAKTLSKMEKTCRELQSRVSSLKDKANWLGKK